MVLVCFGGLRGERLGEFVHITTKAIQNTGEDAVGNKRP